MAITTRETTATGVTNKGAPLTNAEVDTNFIELQQDKIELTDLSVTTNSAGTAALTYTNSTGVFTYTPPDLSGYLTSYTETDPVFTASAASGITSTNITNWNTAYSWGDHSAAGYLTAETNDLTAAVTWANVPDANITESSVTQHEAALSIASTQVTGLGEAVDDQVNTLLQAGLGIDLTYDDINNELTIDSNHVEVNCTNNSGASIAIGTPVYQTGVSGNNITIAPADADDAAKMPAIGLTTSTIANGNEGTVVILGVVNGLNTSSFSAGDTVYVSTTAGVLTTTAPTGESGLIQNFGRVLKVNASAGSIAVMGAGRANAVPNLNNGNVFIGNASNQAETRALAASDIQSGTFADARIAQSNVTQHQAALSITESQISDLQSYLTSVSVDGLSDATITTPADNELLAYDSTSSEWINQTPAEAGFATVATSGAYSDLSGTPTNVSTFTNDAGYLTSFTETNDLSVAVTWANVPDANITQSSVTQHQAALSITESQIADLQSYLTAESDTLDSVTLRGATTTNSVTVGGLHVNATTAVEMPTGTDAERPTPVAGMLRFNTTSTSFEGYDGSAWGAIGGGGGATQGVFYENDQTLSTNVTISGTKNAMATGPVAIASGVSFTVSDGARVVIL